MRYGLKVLPITCDMRSFLSGRGSHFVVADMNFYNCSENTSKFHAGFLLTALGRDSDGVASCLHFGGLMKSYGLH